ncbi:MAG: ankyrin repeat domain-containing protein [Wolbachia endosymbiont of Fragariocoptes setiger]|nr:ankyrin repeat domain-containing protein [Wolbachia endosymbiont of Fragariocoptes setiger]
MLSSIVRNFISAAKNVNRNRAQLYIYNLSLSEIYNVALVKLFISVAEAADDSRESLLYSLRYANRNYIKIQPLLNTSLVFASVIGSTNAIKNLLYAGACINSYFGIFTPMHIAIFLRDKETVKCLLKNKANVNLIDKYGKTFLHYAFENKTNSKIIHLLLKSGLSANLKDKEGSTPLLYLIKGENYLRIHTKEDVTATKFLLEYGANVNEANNMGETPLTCAIFRLQSKNRSIIDLKICDLITKSIFKKSIRKGISTSLSNINMEEKPQIHYRSTIV